MDVLNGATIFWLITVGMVLGAASKLAMGNTTVGLIPNIAAGVAGSVVMGGVLVALDLPGGIIFAVLGSVSILFILNVFHQQTETTH